MIKNKAHVSVLDDIPAVTQPILTLAQGCISIGQLENRHLAILSQCQIANVK